MINYERGKIYKLVCNKTGKVYIGHTTKQLLSERLAEHRYQYTQYNKGNHNKKNCII